MNRKLILVILGVLVLGGAAYGFNLWYQGSHYVITDNAQVSGPLISVTSMSSGQVASLNVDVGDWVDARQTLAQVGISRYSDSGTRQGFSGTAPWVTASIEAPISGYVAAVWTYPGALVSPGMPIVTLFDDSNVWINANVDENKVGRVRPGQMVEVTVDSLGGKVLKGTVAGITPATAANFSLLPQQNTTSNFIKVAQVVTVKITLDNTDGVFLIPGGSVEAKIFTR